MNLIDVQHASITADRLLVFAPKGRDALLISEMLGKEGLQVESCPSMEVLCRHIEEGAGIALIEEEALVGPTLDLLLKALSRQPSWSELPLLILTSGGSRGESSRRILHDLSRANVTLLERPMRIPTLVSAVQVALRARQHQYETRDYLIEREQNEKALSETKEQLSRYAKELEKRVSERTTDLRESLQSLEEVLYHVAHDLRAPLRAMEGLIALLLQDYAPAFNRVGRNYADRIAAAAVHMDQLIQDLLEYGQATHLDVSYVDTSLEECVCQSLASVTEEVKNISAEMRVDRPFPVVRPIPKILETVLVKILENALKFVAPGVVPQIHIWAELKEGMVRLWIEDNGIGISPEHQDRIFRLFERLHPEGSYPGTGIGLAIVAKAMEHIKGRVGVHSKPGEGSRFWLEWPVKRD